jgi:hypothetical protein
MLRLTVLLLLLANAVFYAWSHGAMRDLGLVPTQQSEPQRLEQQIRPQAIRILRADEARVLEPAASRVAKAAECLQAGPFEAVQVAGLKQALETLPVGSWILEPVVDPGRWIIYMGKYATAENAARKKAELRQLGVAFEALSDPALEPGLSLGGFASEAEASQHLDSFLQRGVRSAKVVQERAETRGQLLKFSAVDDSLRLRLDELRPALQGKPLRTCH